MLGGCHQSPAAQSPCLERHQGSDLPSPKTNPTTDPQDIRLDLEERSFYRFSILATQINRAVARAYVRMYGPPANAWKILAVLNKFRVQSASDLKRHTTLDLDKITRIVDQLVERGFVLRKQDQFDGRRVVISLSASGRRATRQLEATIAEMERQFLSALDATERQNFYALLEKLKSRADQIFAE
jgi:DNA-binding MarR family transcriptional regulator